MPIQYLPYALAAYGGYKGYRSSKDAGGSGIQRLLGGATGAALGYYGGQAGLKGLAPESFAAFSKTAPTFLPQLSAANSSTIFKQKESEERFRDFAESGADWFWELNENLQFHYASDRLKCRSSDLI